MATKDIYVHLDGNGQQLQNWAMEPFTTAALAALAGADLYEGRFAYDTDKNKVVHYDGTAWRTLVNSSELNKFGALIGTVDATAGIPDGTTAGQIGSGVDELGVPLTTAASLQKGDFWIVSVAGVIAGIQGNDTLHVGDLLMCTVDGSTTASDWIGIQMNVNDLSLGSGGGSGVFAVTKTAALVAATPLSFAAEMAAAVPVAMTTIRSVQVIEDATGEDITSGLRIDWTAQEVEANVAVASVTITILGE